MIKHDGQHFNLGFLPQHMGTMPCNCTPRFSSGSEEIFSGKVAIHFQVASCVGKKWSVQKK